jgi:hypothetical protein
MMKFKQIDSGEIRSLSYEEVTGLYFESAISRENRSLIVNFMLFLELYANENQIAFHLINENDWARLIHTASNFLRRKALKASLPDG